MAGKVSGPGSGPPSVGGPAGKDDKTEGAAGAGGAKFAEKLADKLTKTDPTRKTGDPSATAAASAARGLTADVAAQLAAGRIDAKAALDRVIERVVDKQLGPGAPAAVREKVRAALESAVADDPVLGDKIRSLATR